MLEETLHLAKFFILDISDIPPAYSLPEVHSRIFLSTIYVGGERVCSIEEYFLCVCFVVFENGCILEHISSISLKADCYKK